jgi:hypothetical protein
MDGWRFSAYAIQAQFARIPRSSELLLSRAVKGVRRVKSLEMRGNVGNGACKNLLEQSARRCVEDTNGGEN